MHKEIIDIVINQQKLLQKASQETNDLSELARLSEAMASIIGRISDDVF